MRHQKLCHKGLPESEKVTTKKRRYKTNTIGVVEQLLQCPHCPYSCRYTAPFHEHFLSHQPDKVFRCSGCNRMSKNRSNINTHIRQAKANLDRAHSKAQAIIIQPIPEHRYEAYRKPIECFEKQFADESANFVDLEEVSWPQMEDCTVELAEEPTTAFSDPLGASPDDYEDDFSEDSFSCECRHD